MWFDSLAAIDNRVVRHYVLMTGPIPGGQHMETDMLNLTEALRISRRGDETGEFNVTVTPETIATIADKFGSKLFYHGLRQKIADAAAGASDHADAKAKMDAVIANLVAGVWGRERGSASNEAPIDRFIRQVVKGMLSEASKLAWKEAEDKDEYLMEKFYTAPDAVQEKIMKAAEEKLAAHIAGKAAKVEISL